MADGSFLRRVPEADAYVALTELLADVLQIPHTDEVTVLDVAVKALGDEPLEREELDLLAAGLIRAHGELNELKKRHGHG